MAFAIVGAGTPVAVLKRLVAGVLIWLALAAPAHAVLEVDINKGQVDPIPIALADYPGPRVGHWPGRSDR
jgi:hypothetical protein